MPLSTELGDNGMEHNNGYMKSSDLSLVLNCGVLGLKHKICGLGLGLVDMGRPKM